MNRNDIKEELRNIFIACIDECGELPDMSQVRDYLEENYGMGNEAEEFVIDLF